MFAKILALILAGMFMTAVVIWLGRQMILFLEEYMKEINEDTGEKEGENHE